MKEIILLHQHDKVKYGDIKHIMNEPSNDSGIRLIMKATTW